MKWAKFLVVNLVLSLVASISLSVGHLQAADFAFGLNGGMNFPMWHTDRMDPGAAADAYWRVDPYEVRFSFAHTGSNYFSVLLGRKHFFSNDSLRPFVEVAGGPVIVNTKHEGLAYGLTPVATLGAELGINETFSSLIALRYSGYIYFGDTKSGSWEANHGLTLVAGVTLWF